MTSRNFELFADAYPLVERMRGRSTTATQEEPVS